MAYISKLLILISLLAMAFSSTIEASQDLEVSLATRTTSGCPRSIFQFPACFGDILTFFSKSKLSPNCCRAIKTIERECWPKWLNFIGLTAKGAEIIDVYCNIVTIH